VLDAGRWSVNSTNSTKFKKRMSDESTTMYGYFRNGGIYITPNLEVAWKRHTHDEPFIIRDNDERGSD
jgi:hypothetical protein